MDTERSTVVEITIPFHDVDPVNIVWHGRYVKYLEVARCQLLDSFHYNYSEMFESGYSWPVVDMRIKYVKPAHFNQKICVIATLKEWEYRLKITYIIKDINSGEILTKGYTTQIAVDLGNGETCYQSPAILLEKLNTPGINE